MQRCNYFCGVIFFQIILNGMVDKINFIPTDVSSVILNTCYSDPCQCSLWKLPLFESISSSSDYDILFLPSTGRVKFIEQKNLENEDDSKIVVPDFQLRYFTNSINQHLPFCYYRISSASDHFKETVCRLIGNMGHPFNPSSLFFNKKLLLNDFAQNNNNTLWVVVKECHRILVFYCMKNPKKKRKIYVYDCEAGYETLCVHKNIPFLEASLMTNSYCDIFKTNKTDPYEIPFEQYQLVPAMRGIAKHAFLGENLFGILANQQFYFGYIDQANKKIFCKKQIIKEFTDDCNNFLEEANVVDFSPNYHPLLYTIHNRTRFILFITKRGKLLCMDINQSSFCKGSLQQIGTISQCNQGDKLDLQETHKISFYDDQVSLWVNGVSPDVPVLKIKMPDYWYHYYEILHGVIPIVSFWRELHFKNIACIQGYIRRLLVMQNQAIKEKSIVRIQAYVRMLIAKKIVEQFNQASFNFIESINNAYMYFKKNCL